MPVNPREHRNYLRREKAKDDKAQMVLCFSGIKPNPNVVVIAHNTLLPLDKEVTCPFCLGLSEFRKFLVSTKQGISRSMGNCPLCKQEMYLKTLFGMSQSDAKKYAKWVFNYKGFWKKIKFKQWKDRLWLMGWTNDFWNEYKALKGQREEEGTEQDESFTDYINRKGQEAAEQWNKEAQTRVMPDEEMVTCK